MVSRLLTSWGSAFRVVLAKDEICPKGTCKDSFPQLSACHREKEFEKNVDVGVELVKVSYFNQACVAPTVLLDYAGEDRAAAVSTIATADLSRVGPVRLN